MMKKTKVYSLIDYYSTDNNNFKEDENKICL